MAFICDDCHYKGTGLHIHQSHFACSRGGCEICGYRDICADCGCTMKRPAAEIAAEVRGEQEALKAARLAKEQAQ